MNTGDIIHQIRLIIVFSQENMAEFQLWPRAILNETKPN